jgi:hypothetical protein
VPILIVIAQLNPAQACPKAEKITAASSALPVKAPVWKTASAVIQIVSE